MIDKKFLFNTHEFNTDTEFTPGFITRLDDYPMSLGNPCIISKQRFSLALDEDYITALIPFGIRYGNPKPNCLYIIKKRDVIIRSGWCMINNGVKLIETFDFNKLKKLSEHVDRKGSAMFSFRAHSAHGSAIPTGKNVIKFMNRIATDILAKYRYHSVFYINYNNDFTAPRGDLRYILHFISIPNCVPILNHRKVDGIGIVFNIVSLGRIMRYRNITPVFCITIILSNYRENIFTIDGVEIEEQNELDPKYLAAAEKIINRSIERKDEYCPKQYVKQKEKKTERNIMPFDGVSSTAITDTNNTTYVSISTSSDASYYIS